MDRTQYYREQQEAKRLHDRISSLSKISRSERHPTKNDDYQF